jgi:hypothetical protein
VGDDQRQRVLVARPDVDEMDVDPVDLCHELGEGIQPARACSCHSRCPSSG